MMRRGSTSQRTVSTLESTLNLNGSGWGTCSLSSKQPWHTAFLERGYLMQFDSSMAVKRHPKNKAHIMHLPRWAWKTVRCLSATKMVALGVHVHLCADCWGAWPKCSVEDRSNFISKEDENLLGVLQALLSLKINTLFFPLCKGNKAGWQLNLGPWGEEDGVRSSLPLTPAKPGSSHSLGPFPFPQAFLLVISFLIHYSALALLVSIFKV